MTTYTYGEATVRVSFNPSEKPEVKEAKRQCAALLDFCNDQMNADKRLSNEESRLIQKAMDNIEEACMWLVKGLTVPKAES